MINISGEKLTIAELVAIAYSNESIELTPVSNNRIRASHQNVLRLSKTKDAFYGINTGYGVFSNKKISIDESKKLNRNLIYSHAVATGEPLENEITRAAMAVRINTLAKGLSGVSNSVVSTIISMLNNGVIPQVSSQGSLGSSGDLCLLAQMCLVLLKDEELEENSGLAKYKNEYLSGRQAMHNAGIERIDLAYKDGLALINGATFSTAITALCCHNALNLYKLANIAEAHSLEALCGRSDAFHKEIHKARGMWGQINSADSISKLFSGSTFVDSLNQIQDAYSLRCAPQVHGAVRETIKFVEGIVTAEINAATDNPLIVEGDKIISGGNFHGEPIGMAADFLGIAISELGAISERRIFRLMDKNLSNGLPEMLVDPSEGEGLNSGVMMLQYTAAALSLENQTLATPDSVKSLPTSANQEDHNANSYNAAIHLKKIIENTTRIIAIELYSAVRGIEIRKRINKSGKLGQGTEKAYSALIAQFPYRAKDFQWRQHLEPLYEMLIKRSELKDKILSIVN